MQNVRRHRWLVLLVALVMVVAAACGDDDDEDVGAGGQPADGDVSASPGITDTTIHLGGSYPLSGPASAYGAIATATEGFFRFVNEEQGGVTSADGKTRQIQFTVYDDSYAPPRMVENVRRLVEQDEVFALFNTLGTPTNTAVVDLLNNQGVPHLYVATGASKWGANTEEWPWTIGWQPAYTTESAIYGQFLQQQFPDGATVAVLFQNDDYGKDYLGGFDAAIEGTNIQVVARESYEVADPTVESQMVNLAQSNADVFFNITTPKFAAQATSALGDLAWDPLHLLNSVSASIESVLEPAGFDAADGLITATYIMDPSDPDFAETEAMQQYRERVQRFAPDLNVDDPFGVYGFAVGETMVKSLEAMEAPTREALMEAVRNLEDLDIPLLIPGITVNTGPDDGYPIEAMQLRRFDAAQRTFVAESDVISFEGETPVVE